MVLSHLRLQTTELEVEVLPLLWQSAVFRIGHLQELVFAR